MALLSGEAIANNGTILGNISSFKILKDHASVVFWLAETEQTIYQHLFWRGRSELARFYKSNKRTEKFSVLTSDALNRYEIRNYNWDELKDVFNDVFSGFLC